MTKTIGGAATLPRLISVRQAAELLAVSDETVRNWIGRELIPHIVLPHEPEARKEYRIPLQGLLTSLSGTYDLAADLSRDLEALNEAARQTGRGVDPLAEMFDRPR